jgi:hypothetical protein
MHRRIIMIDCRSVIIRVKKRNGRTGFSQSIGIREIDAWK